MVGQDIPLYNEYPSMNGILIKQKTVVHIIIDTITFPLDMGNISFISLSFTLVSISAVNNLATLKKVISVTVKYSDKTIFTADNKIVSMNL